MSDISKKDIYNLIIPRLDVELYYVNLDYRKTILGYVEKNILGFCLFKGNIERVKSLVLDLKSKREDLIISGDYEFGLSMRHSGGTNFPHAMAFGKSGDTNKTFICSQLIANELRSLNIDWNFAPVCDINSNPKNPIINIRSYGEDIETVSENIAYYIKGHQYQGIIATAKHFPGHGDTDVDSHLSLPTLNKSREEILNFELIPFKKAIKNEVLSIMIGHLAVPSIDEENLPASLSKKIIQNLLIEELKYKGLIITDALDMKAILDNFSIERATELAIKAGVNVLLLPPEPDQSAEHLMNLVEFNSEIKYNILNSIDKVEEIKKWLKNREPKENIKVDRYENEKISLNVANSATKLNLRTDDMNLLPLNPEHKISIFAFLQKEEDFEKASVFFELLSEAVGNDMDYAYIDTNISDEDINEMKLSTRDSDLFIFIYFYKARAYNGSIGSSEKIQSIITKLTLGIPIINIFFGNPYISEDLISDIDIFTYSDSPASVVASIMKLTGKEF